MSALTTQRGFLGTVALLFAVSAAVTVAWCGSMASMPGMQMPGGWTMSMAWMRMPGQTYGGAFVTFIGMWTLMMIAMMLPVLVPMLMRYRAELETTPPRRRDALTARVAAGYFGVWSLSGALTYPIGVALADAAMRDAALSACVPVARALVMMLAGVVQLGAWKARRLACCRALRADADTAWREGLRYGLRCLTCCAPLTAVLLVLGVMDCAAMALVTAAICVERLAPAGPRLAKGVGVVIVAAGFAMLAGAI